MRFTIVPSRRTLANWGEIGTHEEIRSRVSLAFSRLQSCLWSRRKISLRTNRIVYQFYFTIATDRQYEQPTRGWWRSTGEAQRLHISDETEAPPASCMYAGGADSKNDRTVWPHCKASRGWANQGYPFACTVSEVAQANWRTAKAVGNRTKGRPGTLLRTTSRRLHTLESSYRTFETGVPPSET